MSRDDAAAPHTPRPVGSCFGFTVHAERPLAYVRDGVGDLDLELVEGDLRPPTDLAPLSLWRLSPGDDVTARLLGDVPEGRYALWVRGSGWFHVDTRARRVVVPTREPPVRREERVWGIPALLCLWEQGNLPLHAAAVEVDGSSLLLAAPSRHGKTTLAAAMLAAGMRLLTEDLACVSLDRAPSVLPGPAMLRPRRDVAPHLDVPGSRVVATADDRVHLTLDHPHRGDGNPVPLAGIMLLQPTDTGRCELERVPSTAVLPDLWSLSYHVPDGEAHARCFGQLTDLAAQVPVWEVRRPLRLDGQAEVVDRIREVMARV